ncbi:MULTISPECIES: translation initiation factor 2 [Pseudomonas]|uniref:translation initiation factor 2 n=1 Tax=Pseudomonas TaxID=286 RepID=UPI0016550F7A|nr:MULTISPECIES: translation initiation factor 2 [Pseudomonas]MBC8881064.1 translation initiation factor 2 [Pseudomonas cerasi]MCH5653283.1 translation initiation factor 2 [Pseudomonas syringae]QNR43274.1 translation initiation factor 2 [Pseudomonas syringae]
MRSATWCLLAILVAASVQVNAETVGEGGAVQPLHQPGTASQMADLQVRLNDSERQREELTRQLQNADPERNNALLTRLRQENQKLKLQLKEALSAAPPRLLTEQQQWFIAGGGVAMFALLCGILVSGWRRQRRQWLN